jgi:signal transduction histidine kinase
VEAEVTAPPADAPLAAVVGNGLRRVLLPLFFLLAYLGVDQVNALGPAPPLVLTPWNPALGLCIAAAMHWRARIMPFVLLAPVLGQLLAPDAPHIAAYGVWLGLVTLAQTGASVAGGEWLSRKATSPLLGNRVLAVLLVSLPVALIIAAFRMIFLSMTDIAPVAQFVEGMIRIWVGDVIGTFVIMPLCMLLLSLQRARPFAFRNALETAAQAACVLGAVWLAFGENPDTAGRYFYLVFLPMIWIVLRSGMNGAIILNAFVQLSMVVSLALAGHKEVDVTLFQAILLVMAASSLTLGIAVDQSRTATQMLRARESELAASLKVAATGELAGTLAHELGHPLGAISNYAAALNHVIGKIAPDSQEARDIGNKLSREIQRATDTLHRLRDFFRTGSLAIERVDLGELAKEAVTLLKDRFEHNGIGPHIVTQPGANAILADRVQLHAVVHNLLVNAVDALKQVPEHHRALSISIRRTEEAVTLAVEDSGPGISPDVREQIFEPLTTTKKDGLGLGLSMSRSVVTAHGGRIHLEDSRLGGARFVITLPVRPA